MSDSMTKSQLLCLATIGVVLVPQYHAFPTNCPVVTCKRGQQYQKPCGPCVPCPENTFMPDEVRSDFGEDCMPYLECGEGAVRNCSQSGRQCPADEAQHCVCDLDKNYYGNYPVCVQKFCPGGTTLKISGSCIPIASPPSLSPVTSPSSSPMLGPLGHLTDPTSAMNKSDPIPVSTPAAPEVMPKTDVPCSCSTTEKHEAENKWIMLFIGIAIGVVVMAFLVLVTVCVVVYIYMSNKGRRREHDRQPEQRSFPSLASHRRGSSASSEAMNGDPGRPMLGQMPTEGDDPTPVTDDVQLTLLPQSPSLSALEEEAPDTHPNVVN